MRILILEDETLIALDLADELRSEGHDVSGPANTIGEAHDLLDQDDIDFAVLDANINGEAPVSLVEELRRRGIFFVYVSGYDEEYVRRVLPAGPVLAKPLEVTALHGLIQGVLERRGA